MRQKKHRTGYFASHYQKRLVIVALLFILCCQQVFVRPLYASISLAETVNLALQKNEGILLQKEVLNNVHGSFLQTRSLFDPVLSLSTGYSNDMLPAVMGPSSRSIVTSLSVSNLLPIGITITPAVSIKQIRLGSMASNQAQSGVTFDIPLFAGFGNNVSKTARDAAEIEYRAAGFGCYQAATTGVYNTAAAYCDYLYAYLLLQVDHELTESAEKQLHATQALAHADEIAFQRVDLARAYLENSRATEQTAVLQLKAAWELLLLSTGSRPSGREAPETPIDFFPEPHPGVLGSLIDSTLLSDYALSHRSDLKALYLQKSAAVQRLEGSKNLLKPNVSLSLWAGYNSQISGTSFQDYVFSVTRNIPGTSVSATITYTLPIGNNSAQSNYIQNMAAYETSLINQEALARNVLSTVSLDVASVRNAIFVYEMSRKSAESYRRLKEGELKKFRMGMSSIFDLQTISNNLASAEIQLLGAKKTYALAVLNLRYATGTLLKGNDELFTVEAKNLFTIPKLGEIAK